MASFFSKTSSLFLHRNSLRSLAFCIPFSFSALAASDKPRRQIWKQPVVSALEPGGVKIVKEGAVEMLSVDTNFPFTNPSFQREIFFKEKWMEVLGCGVTEQEILKRSGRTNNVAWAFGLGLQRLAMVLFDIPDIRLFWSTDMWFTAQDRLSVHGTFTDEEINELPVECKRTGAEQVEVCSEMTYQATYIHHHVRIWDRLQLQGTSSAHFVHVYGT